ncbi:MAG: hypothetical protein E6G77_12940 [Alphaproteobacteria bacterium]|nr:MAG: hypothetical protein E6G77_12940 [Alphaproteobacteria bacterium]
MSDIRMPRAAGVAFIAGTALISRRLRRRSTDRERLTQRRIVRKPLRSEHLVLPMYGKAFTQCLAHRAQGRE